MTSEGRGRGSGEPPDESFRRLETATDRLSLPAPGHAVLNDRQLRHPGVIQDLTARVPLLAH
jgi:hypothetical protein